MTSKSNALSLTTAAPAKRMSFKDTPQSYIMAQISQKWATMDASTRAGWQTLTDKQLAPTVEGVRSRHSAYGTFFAHNSALLNAGATTISNAPDAPTDIALPALTLTASYVGPTLVLTLHAAASYPFRTILYGAKPLYDGQDAMKKGEFKRIGALENLDGNPNITALYLSKFRLPTPGYQIALKLIGVSVDGFRSVPAIVTAVAYPGSTENAPNLTVG